MAEEGLDKVSNFPVGKEAIWEFGCLVVERKTTAWIRLKKVHSSTKNSDALIEREKDPKRVWQRQEKWFRDFYLCFMDQRELLKERSMMRDGCVRRSWMIQSWYHMSPIRLTQFFCEYDGIQKMKCAEISHHIYIQCSVYEIPDFMSTFRLTRPLF